MGGGFVLRLTLSAVALLFCYKIEYSLKCYLTIGWYYIVVCGWARFASFRIG